MREGELVLLEKQDRSLWDRIAIQDGVELLERSMRLGTNRPVGAYQLQAAIAALHAQADPADATDWAVVEPEDFARALEADLAARAAYDGSLEHLAYQPRRRGG